MDGNPGEWAVAFHGISCPKFVALSVIKEGLMPGPR